MNDADVRELLDRAAEQVRPRSSVTGAALRARARRRQQTVAAMATAGLVACVIAGVAVSTADLGAPTSSRVPATSASSPPSADPTVSPPPDGPTVSLPIKAKSVSVNLPAGWRQERVNASFDPCTARANTLYLGGDPKRTQNMWSCLGGAQPWAWVTGLPAPNHDTLAPKTLVIAGGELGYLFTTEGLSLTETPDPALSQGKQITLPWQQQVVTIVAKDKALRQQLRQSIRAPIPPEQPLVLPPRADIVEVVGEIPGGGFQVGDKDAALAIVDLLRGFPAVDPASACAWKEEATLGMDLGNTKVLVSKDPACLQAVSSAGGRVKVDAGTADQLYALLYP